MNRLKALATGSVVAGSVSAYTGGIGITALGGGVGVGFIPITLLGGLLALGGYEIYRLGERRAKTDKGILERYDLRYRIAPEDWHS